LGCTYCYENPDRERSEEWAKAQYDIDKIMQRLKFFKKKNPNTPPGLHGGEPLLMKREDIRRVFRWVDENYEGSPHIQTNATLIDDEVIEIFKEFNVNVGVSCDGPKELNRLRKASGELEKKRTKVTDKMTEQTLDAIDRMIDEGISGGVIVVLQEKNAGTEERFEKLLDWMDYLCENNWSGHFNPAIPYEDIQNDVSLDPERLKDCYLKTWEWMKEKGYRRWNPMNNYVDNLLGNNLKNCVNNKCDVFNAGAAQIIDGDGETTGCGKTWSTVGDGVPFLQGPSTDNEYGETEERYKMLKQLPGGPDRAEDEPDMGGCKGCEYWNVCQGGCPSSGVEDDYRTRTIWCKAKYALYEKVEHDLRALLPNIDLITDLPWDADLSEAASYGQLDLKPFSGIKPGERGASSAFGHYESEAGSVFDRVPDEVIGEDGFDARLQKMKSQYPERVIESDREKGAIHVDSANPDQLKSDGKQDVKKEEISTEQTDNSEESCACGRNKTCRCGNGEENRDGGECGCGGKGDECNCESGEDAGCGCSGGGWEQV
jgi:uncharacterized protein